MGAGVMVEVLKRGFGMWWGEGEGLVEVEEGSLKQKESTLAMRQQVDQDPNPRSQDSGANTSSDDVGGLGTS